jgi:hypothetical protein
LYSIIPREGYDPVPYFNGLKNIKSVFLEEFQYKESRKHGRYVVYYHVSSEWREYELHQQFGSLKDKSGDFIREFSREEIQKRILGNCCVLLCGEINGVKYSKADKKVHDVFGLRQAIPRDTNIILNPSHDRMIRFEMKLKRKFLSENNRWVIAVWNRGKKDKNGKVRDGKRPAWSVCFRAD